MLVEDRLEYLGSRIETAVEKSVDEFRKEPFRILHLGFRRRAGFLRRVTLPGVVLSICIAADRAIETSLCQPEVLENVPQVLLRVFDLRLKRLLPERRRILRAGASHHDLWRIGDARAAKLSRKVVLDLDAEAHDCGIVEPARDEVDHMGTTP